MNDNDMNEMIKKAQSMIQNNQIPDDIKKLINNFQNSNSNNFNSQTNTNNVKNNYNYNKNNNNSNFDKSINSNNSNTSNNSNNSNNSNTSNNFHDSINSNSTNQNNSMPDIDIETMMKIQKIMSQMKNSNDDDMSKLLISLKPYLRDTKKDKLDEYIKLIKMGKMTQLFNSFGGDQKY